ncbi:LutB/LldF family L-lactate oxidation iron-sulfur protein [Calditrichota bacterium]
MSESTQFKKRAAEKSADESHRLKILKAISTYEGKVGEMKTSQFIDWQSARQTAAQIKKYVIENLPDLLEQFEQNISKTGTKVLWAETAREAQNHLLDIAKAHSTKKIVKSKSMTTEEIDFNEFFKANGIDVWESDLGELIVQLAEEKPYHIVTPAMHKSKQEISKLFAEKLGSAESDSAEELTMVARKYLRDAYVTADIGVTGANFLISDIGAVSLTENEGNIRLSTACPKIHVVIAGIEKILPRVQDLSLFLPLLATSGTGQQITGYNSLFLGPRNEEELDGPQEMYVILLDNGRSNLYLDDTFRHALSCIRCGACLNACPVYRTIGGHTYHTTYQGPIGSVLTPHFRGMEQWNHLASASSLCGACTQVCPVKIDIHHLLLQNRFRATQQNNSSKFIATALKMWSFIMTHRNRLNKIRKPGNIANNMFSGLMPKGIRKRIPELSKKSFAELWSDNE